MYWCLQSGTACQWRTCGENEIFDKEKIDGFSLKLDGICKANGGISVLGARKLWFSWKFGFSGEGFFDFDGNVGFRGHEIVILMESWVFGVRKLWFWWKFGMSGWGNFDSDGNWGFLGYDFVILMEFGISGWGNFDIDGNLFIRCQEIWILMEI